MATYDRHLTVEILEGAEAKIAMISQRSNAHGSLIHALTRAVEVDT